MSKPMTDQRLQAGEWVVSREQVMRIARRLHRAVQRRTRKAGRQVTTYDVDITKEGEYWLADVRDLPGAHTYATNLLDLRNGVTEVIALVTDSDEPVTGKLRYTWNK